jgi:hypothetical protein
LECSAKQRWEPLCSFLEIGDHCPAHPLLRLLWLFLYVFFIYLQKVLVYTSHGRYRHNWRGQPNICTNPSISSQGHHFVGNDKQL